MFLKKIFILSLSFVVFNIFGQQSTGSAIPIDIDSFFKDTDFFNEDYTFYCGKEYFNFKVNDKEYKNKDNVNNDDLVVFDRIIPLNYFFNHSKYFNINFKKSCEQEFDNKDYYECARKNIPLFVQFERDIYNIFLVAKKNFDIRNKKEFALIETWRAKHNNSCVIDNNSKFLVKKDILGDIARVILYLNQKYSINYMQSAPLKDWALLDPISKFECYRYYRFRELYLSFNDNYIYSTSCNKYFSELFEKNN